MPSDQDASTDDENVFYFESDHLALRGNPDYCNMLRTIVKLHAQKLRVHEQIDELEQMKKHYMADPDLLIEKIKNNEPIISPNYMTIEEIPELSKNYESMEFPELEQEKVKTEPVDESTVDVKTNIQNLDIKRPGTFKCPWTNEEQRRLEELLIKYPEEEFESRRFSKIAKALGNRTMQQVTSRVQKYFLKLQQAGLPVPGRMPKYRKQNTKNQRVFRSTTFFPAHNISVKMPEEDDFLLDAGLGSSLPASVDSFTSVIKKENIKTEEDSEQAASAVEDDIKAFSSKSRSSDKLMLQMLKTIRDEKIKTAEGYNPDPLAAKCAECEVETVARTLWRCNSCYCYLNLCLDCLTDQLVSNRFEHITHDVSVEQEA